MFPVLKNRSNQWSDEFSKHPSSQSGHFDSMLDHLFNPEMMNGAEGYAWYPVNIWEDDNGVYLQAEMPGYLKGDVKITFEKGILFLQAEREPSWRWESDQPEANKQEVLIERRRMKYARSFRISTLIDEERITASMSDGLLHIVLPKRAEAKPKSISIT